MDPVIFNGAQQNKIQLFKIFNDSGFYLWCRDNWHTGVVVVVATITGFIVLLLMLLMAIMPLVRW